MKKTEIIRGRVAACSEVEQYTKKNGEPGAKCVFHIVGTEGIERAITATGELTNWKGCEGLDVEVEYVNRVFEFSRKGKAWYGTDCYAVNIKSI